MIKTFFISTILFATGYIGIYSIQVYGLKGSDISFSAFKGKKILIVNTASGSPQAYQLAQLKQLYNLYHDSLVIVAFPTNSFGHEPKGNIELKQYMDSAGIPFPVAMKSEVKGNNMNILYKWLSSKQSNEGTDSRAVYDFQKYLVDKTGVLVAVYDSGTAPLSTILQHDIQHY